MHRTIANKTYDTTTAKALGNWQKGYASERGYISETLYLKKNGEYFLHGEGGPRSRYAQRVAPNTWGYGERILPLSNDEAHAWAENHLNEPIFEGIFSGVEDDGTLTSVTFKLHAATVEKLNRVAHEKGCQMSELVEAMLFGALEQREASGSVKK